MRHCHKQPRGGWHARRLYTAAGLAILCAPFFTSAQANPRDTAAIDSAVHALRAAQDRNDQDGIRSLSAPSMVVIDDVPPFLWNGADATGNWTRDFGIEVSHRGIEDIRLTFRDEPTTRLSGKRSLYTTRTDFEMRRAGAPMTKRGLETFILEKQDSRWLHAGYAWFGPGEVTAEGLQAAEVAHRYLLCGTPACRATLSTRHMVVIGGRPPFSQSGPSNVAAGSPGDATATLPPLQARAASGLAFVALRGTQRAHSLVLQRVNSGWRVTAHAVFDLRAGVGGSR